MFLDDELLLMVKKADCSTEENIQQLNVDLCTKCEKYYKEKLYPQITKKEVKTILDKTFNMWDSFIRMGKKEDEKIKIIVDMFEKYSFKKQLLSNKEMARIYNEL